MFIINSSNKRERSDDIMNNKSKKSKSSTYYLNTMSGVCVNDDNVVPYQYNNSANVREFHELPISIILYILQFYEFPFQNALCCFSLKYDVMFSSQYNSSPSLSTNSIWDLSNPDQVLLKTLSQYQRKKQSAIETAYKNVDMQDTLLLTSSSNNLLNNNNNNGFNDDNIFQMNETPNEEEGAQQYVQYTSQRTANNNNNNLITFLRYAEEDEAASLTSMFSSRYSPSRILPTDLQLLFFRNGKPIFNLYEILAENENKRGFMTAYDAELEQSNTIEETDCVYKQPITTETIQKNIPACLEHIYKLLTCVLYGRFSKDRTGTIYCIFTSISINSINFPHKLLLKMMSIEERRHALKYVMYGKYLQWKNNGSLPSRIRNVISDIDLTIHMLYKKHIQLLFKNLSSMLHRLVHLDASELELQDSDLQSFVENCLKMNINDHCKSFNKERRIIIQSLDLSRNRISDDGVKAICQIPSLCYLYLNTNDIGELGAAELFKNAHMKTLMLSYNNIVDRSILSMSNQQYSNITELDLSFNMLNEQGIWMLCECKFLKKLHLKFISLKNEVVAFFLQLTNLQMLDLSCNSIGDEGAITLAKHPSVHELHLGFNNISNSGACALFMNNKLTILSLNNNVISSEGLKILPFNKTLLHLDLSNNSIDDLGAVLVAKHFHLKSVNLANNNITIDGARHFLLCPHMKFNLKSQYIRQEQQMQFPAACNGMRMVNQQYYQDARQTNTPNSSVMILRTQQYQEQHVFNGVETRQEQMF